MRITIINEPIKPAIIIDNLNMNNVHIEDNQRGMMSTFYLEIKQKVEYDGLVIKNYTSDGSTGLPVIYWLNSGMILLW